MSSNDQPTEATTSRRGFLRKLGSTVAIGIGAAAVPSLASASPDYADYYCCPTTDHACMECGSGMTNYWCSNAECKNGFCYGCKTNTGCFDVIYPYCV